MTKYINGTTFKPASEIAQEVEPVDIVSHLQLRLANGEKLDSILRSYAWYLAGELDAVTEAMEALTEGAGTSNGELQRALRQGRLNASAEVRQLGGR